MEGEADYYLAIILVRPRLRSSSPTRTESFSFKRIQVFGVQSDGVTTLLGKGGYVCGPLISSHHEDGICYFDECGHG